MRCSKDLVVVVVVDDDDDDDVLAGACWKSQQVRSPRSWMLGLDKGGES